MKTNKHFILATLIACLMIATSVVAGPMAMRASTPVRISAPIRTAQPVFKAPTPAPRVAAPVFKTQTVAPKIAQSVFKTPSDTKAIAASVFKNGTPPSARETNPMTKQFNSDQHRVAAEKIAAMERKRMSAEKVKNDSHGYVPKNHNYYPHETRRVVEKHYIDNVIVVDSTPPVVYDREDRPIPTAPVVTKNKALSFLMNLIAYSVCFVLVCFLISVVWFRFVKKK